MMSSSQSVSLLGFGRFGHMLLAVQIGVSLHAHYSLAHFAVNSSDF